ncbi:MAG: precorrin-2 C(20)-methyltransferase [Deltaproteobacteria bacterium]|nr:MAG: precorrin-2 C(20)-methyltransferase [Deltaproteobacteria bacterium]
MTRKGTLYAIGVGPGDPELISLKAVRILKQVAVVYAASSTKNTYSLAEKIVSPYLKEGVRVVRLNFPMTRDKKKLSQAWENNTRQIVNSLKDGNDAAFITLGDPMTYSTFGYIMRAIKQGYPEIAVSIIPGITSYQAGAAAAGRVLAEAEESFAVISGALGAKKLKEVIAHADSVVMLKVYRNFREILDTLSHLELGASSVLISQCGLEGEKISRDLQEHNGSIPPYLSLLLIKKRDR